MGCCMLRQTRTHNLKNDLDGICGSFENAMSWVAFGFTNVKWIDLESLLQKVHLLAQFGMLCVLFIMEIWV